MEFKEKELKKVFEIIENEKKKRKEMIFNTVNNIICNREKFKSIFIILIKMK